MTAGDAQQRANLDEAHAPAPRDGRASSLDRLQEQLLPHVNLSACPASERSRLLEQLTAPEFVLVIGNDLRLVPLLVDFISQRFVQFLGCSRKTSGQLGVAVGEAVINAIVHGNLEIESDIRDEPGDVYDKQIEARRLDPRFRHRRVRIICQYRDHTGRVTVRDEGPGFDATTVPDPTAEENLSRPYGRGILLIRAFFDDVCYSPKGNSVTMVKHECPCSYPNGGKGDP
jgi:anti-sigma regulatory factor (Ser/Thr protein kinase)